MKVFFASILLLSVIGFGNTFPSANEELYSCNQKNEDLSGIVEKLQQENEQLKDEANIVQNTLNFGKV